METPGMMLAILSEATGKKRRGRTGECPTGAPSSTVAQGAPWGRYPGTRQGPLRGLGRECGRSWERCQVTHLSWTSLSRPWPGIRAVLLISFSVELPGHLPSPHPALFWFLFPHPCVLLHRTEALGVGWGKVGGKRGT